MWPDQAEETYRQKLERREQEESQHGAVHAFFFYSCDRTGRRISRMDQRKRRFRRGMPAASA